MDSPKEMGDGLILQAPDTELEIKEKETLLKKLKVERHKNLYKN